MSAPSSLVLITVDCLRADHVGFLGYPRPTTPFLDSLATESFVFSNAIVAGAPTYYSFPAILASRYPLALGRDVVGLAPGEPALASVLRQAGYTTACFSAANPYLSRQFGFDQSFDTFRDFLEGEPATLPGADSPYKEDQTRRSRVNQRLAEFCKDIGVGAVYDELYFQYCQRFTARPAQSLETLRRFPAADVIVDQARTWLAANAEGPLFLWLHFMDPHAPYYPVDTALGMMGNQKISPFRAQYLNASWNRGDIKARRFRRHYEGVIALYDAGIRWVDTQIARLVDILRRYRLWDRCTLAFTADHGEEFFDHGGRYHAPTKLTEELIRVPLLLRAPGMQARWANSPFSLLHLAPTLLESVGVKAPDEFQGNSHWSQLTDGVSWDSPAIVECVAGCANPSRSRDRMGPRLLAVREQRHKLVLQFQIPGEHLYDLEADPAERAPLPRDAEPRIRRRLLESAHTHMRSSIEQRDSKLRLAALLRELRETLEKGQSADAANG